MRPLRRCGEFPGYRLDGPVYGDVAARTTPTRSAPITMLSYGIGIWCEKGGTRQWALVERMACGANRSGKPLPCRSDSGVVQCRVYAPFGALPRISGLKAGEDGKIITRAATGVIALGAALYPTAGRRERAAHPCTLRGMCALRAPRRWFFHTLFHTLSGTLVVGVVASIGVSTALSDGSSRSSSTGETG